MAGITLAQAEAQLTAWLNASTAVAEGKHATIDGNTVTHEDADKVQKMIMFWDTQVKRLTRGGIRVRGVTPV